MENKRAILTGALLWVLIFFEISILMFGFKLNTTTTYFVHYLVLIPLVIFCSWLYFKGKHTNLTVKEGFKISLIFIATGIVLDLLITVLLFVKSLSFFFVPYLWVGYLETIILCIIYPPIKKTWF